MKSKFLEGKRNWRLDHLLYVLLDLVVPYYIGRVRQQDFGFEGPDLEVKKQQEITERALTVPKDFITEIEAGHLYHVRSQSGSHHYHVDLDAYTCGCLSYPLINFCKHLCVVQNHFPIGQKPGEIFTLDKQDTEIQGMEDSGEDLGEEDKDQEKISGLVDKLQHLSVRTQLQRPLKLTPALANLDQSLDAAFSDLGHTEDVDRVLPKHKRVAPNQRSGWHETATVMGTNIKTKRASKHTDPYSAKEASGKKAQPDAMRPLKRKKVGDRWVLFSLTLHRQ